MWPIEKPFQSLEDRIGEGSAGVMEIKDSILWARDGLIGKVAFWIGMSFPLLNMWAWESQTVFGYLFPSL